ncbi:MAG: SRPBCC domain-containing protein [Dehalococcoidia bacterium]
MTQEAHHQLPFEARVERLVDAPAEAVFDAFTSREAHLQWFVDPDAVVESLTLDARVGGRWDCAFDHEGERYAWEGVFTEVERPTRLVIEIVNLWPGGERFPSRMTVTCEERGSRTLLTISEMNIDERHRDEALSGIPGLADIVQRIAEQETADR